MSISMDDASERPWRRLGPRLTAGKGPSVGKVPPESPMEKDPEGGRPMEEAWCGEGEEGRRTRATTRAETSKGG